MFFMREEYKPWQKMSCRSLSGAKRSAARRTAYKGTRVQIAVKKNDLLYILAVRHGRSQWDIVENPVGFCD